MAFRGAIAVTKAFKISKDREKNNKEKVKRWENSFMRQKSLFPSRRESDSDFHNEFHEGSQGAPRLRTEEEEKRAGPRR